MYLKIFQLAFFPFTCKRNFDNGPFRVKFLAVLKLPTAKIDFIDFLEIEAAFLKTNYITFSYLPIATDEQNISAK